MTFDAASTAALEVQRVLDVPLARYQAAARYYRDAEGSRRRYGAAELSFLRWELSRGVLAPPDAEEPGSAWWRAVNERLLRDKAEGDLVAAGAHGGASATSVELWVDFVRQPTPSAWYRAHNASIVAAYLENEALAAGELQVERFMMNVALLRVLYAQALVASPRLALGPLARLGPVLADPRGPTVGLFLDLRRSFPSHYPLRLRVTEAIAREQPLARVLDYGVIAPRLAQLYQFAADCLVEPRVTNLVDDGGAPAYAWPRADRFLWDAGNTGWPLRAVGELTGARGTG